MAETPPREFLTFLQAEHSRVPRPAILEIGGGATTYVQWPRARYTVVDASSETLARCTYADETVLADAESFEPGREGYDVVVFWNVLEHVPDPPQAIRRAAKGVKPRGLLIARGPELKSLKALVTRLTPHWLHVLFYRYVLEAPEAGKPGRAPYPVEHSPGASAEAIVATLLPLGFRVVYDQRYVGDQLQLLRKYSGLAYLLYRSASALLRLVTGRRWGGRPTEFVLALRKSG